MVEVVDYGPVALPFLFRDFPSERCHFDDCDIVQQSLGEARLYMTYYIL